MIHARTDYNRIQDPENKIPENEPVFLLRGKDPLAPTLLLEWAKQLRLNHGDPNMAHMVEKHAQSMIVYQATFPGGITIPDLPEDYWAFVHVHDTER